MHPILGHPRRLAIYALAWLLVGLLLAAGLGRDAARPTALVYFLPLSLAYGLMALSTWYICRAFPLGGRPAARTGPWNVVLVHVLAAALASSAWVGLAGVWGTALRFAGLTGDTPFVAPGDWPLLLVVGLLLFWLAVVFHYLLIAFEASREAETRALELSLLAREAELRALRAQIDPHFIFNSLHSISALTAIDPPAARRMCLLLAEFLRETLRLGSHQRIPLGDELALAGRFLAIEQIRLGPRLQVDSETPPEAARCLVPPLLLQPLVENAVVHGIGQLVEGGALRIAASRSDAMLTITLENPCDPDRPRTRGVGLGLELLRRRLTTQFGIYDAVRAVEQSGRFRVEVRVPAVETGGEERSDRLDAARSM